MQPLGIHHVALNVDDVPAAVASYTTCLGGTLRADRPDLGIDGAWIDLGSSQIHLLKGPLPTDVGQHVALQVSGLAALVDELRAKGLEVGDPFLIAGDAQTFVLDPSGNAIELHEVRSA